MTSTYSTQGVLIKISGS